MIATRQFTALATFVALVLAISGPAGASPLSNTEESSIIIHVGSGQANATGSSYPGYSAFPGTNATIGFPTTVSGSSPTGGFPGTNATIGFPTPTGGFPGTNATIGFPTTVSGPSATGGFPGTNATTGFPTTIFSASPTGGFPGTNATTVPGPFPSTGPPAHGHSSGCLPHTVTTTVFVYPSNPAYPWYPPGGVTAPGSTAPSPWYPPGSVPAQPSSGCASHWCHPGGVPASSAVASPWYPPGTGPAPSSAIASSWYPSGSVAFPSSAPTPTTRVCGHPSVHATPSSGNGNSWPSASASFPGNENGTFPISLAPSATAYPTE
ncbi:hypothetical protein BDZ94DRAFT_1298945 [Collybia nuda]|uniref:Uncharacterized protein n=1 Tax=Collybia nuda TaxID=64659 RepID=A0A9P5Y1R8_9AGAR|nr:hypothetical protein BDZ94DRAFT_1298945 [Collybia nuda]